MELLLIPLIILLIIGFFVALSGRGAPARSGRGRTHQEEDAPAVERDPGVGRPAGPSAEGQHSEDAGTLHPPSQSADEDGAPDAVPPYQASGKQDPGRESRGD